MKQCNKCGNRKCRKLSNNKFPQARKKHKLDIGKMRESCPRYERPYNKFKLEECVSKLFGMEVVHV